MGGQHIPTGDPESGVPKAVTGNPDLHVAIRWLVHAVFWTFYLFIGLPLQLAPRTVRYMETNPSIAKSIKDFVSLCKFLLFLTNKNRAVLFLRASWVWTPSKLIPFMPGENVIKEDPTVETGPYPDNWDEIRQEVFQRDDYTCTCCGAQGGPHGESELHPDHVVPRSRDGADTPDNLRTLCRLCHQARHARFFSKNHVSYEDGVVRQGN